MTETPQDLSTIRLLVVMGMAGCGKTTIGEHLAAAMAAMAPAPPLNSTFLDGDSFHPQANIDKMSQGIALTDEDRWPWLETFGREIAARPGTVIGGCSSLKRAYRDHITQAAGEPVLFIYLNGSRELIAERMGKRQGHFMPTSLLDSQFATLEVPAEDECAIDVDIDAPTDEIVRRILAKLGA